MSKLETKNEFFGTFRLELKKKKIVIFEIRTLEFV